MKNSLLGIGTFLQVPALLFGFLYLFMDGRDWTIYPWSAVYYLVNYLLVFLVAWSLFKGKEECKLFAMLVLILSVMNAVSFWFTAYNHSFLAVPCYLGLLFVILAGLSLLNDPSAKWSFEWLVELYQSKCFLVFLLFSLMLCFNLNTFRTRFERFMFEMSPEELSIDACYVVDVQGVEGFADVSLIYKQPNTVFSTYCAQMNRVYEVNGEQVKWRTLKKTLKDGDTLKISLRNPNVSSRVPVSTKPVEIDVKLYRKITSYDDFLMPFEEYVALTLEQAQMEPGEIKESYLLNNEKGDVLIAVHLITETRYNLWVVMKNPHEMKCRAVTCENIGEYFSLSDIEFSCAAEIVETWEANQ